MFKVKAKALNTMINAAIADMRSKPYVVSEASTIHVESGIFVQIIVTRDEGDLWDIKIPETYKQA